MSISSKSALRSSHTVRALPSCHVAARHATPAVLVLGFGASYLAQAQILVLAVALHVLCWDSPQTRAKPGYLARL